jgi:hypothetical protein
VLGSFIDAKDSTPAKKRDESASVEKTVAVYRHQTSAGTTTRRLLLVMPSEESFSALIAKTNNIDMARVEQN